jgi:hypothetical protein
MYMLLKLMPYAYAYVPTALETFMASGGGGGGSSPRALFLDHQPSECKACCNDVAVPPLGFASE